MITADRDPRHDPTAPLPLPLPWAGTWWAPLAAALAFQGALVVLCGLLAPIVAVL